MPQVADLASLQDYDDILARLTADLDEARADLEDDEALQAAQTAATEADERCASLEREQRRLEGEIDGLVAKVEREEKRLYDGSVRLPKELEGIQKEGGVAAVAPLRHRGHGAGIARQAGGGGGGAGGGAGGALPRGSGLAGEARAPGERHRGARRGDRRDERAAGDVPGAPHPGADRAVRGPAATEGAAWR